MSDARAAYLPELAGLIWPAPLRATLRRGGRGDYYVVPSAARPRLLVPAGGRAAAVAVGSATEATGAKARLRQAVIAGLFRAGVGPLVFRDRVAVARPAGDTAVEADLDALLTAVLGRPALLSIHIGPPRANRKPVLQLLARDGAALGFAKLGVDPLTRSLVDAEAAALARLRTANLGPVVVPGIVHHGRWGEHALLVQSALPVRLPRAAGAVAAAADRSAMVTVAGCLGRRRTAYADGSYPVRLAASVRALSGRPEAERLVTVLDTVTAYAPHLEYGCWHGDWNGGNSAVLADGRVLIWDWERFDEDVPVGYDALHARLQTTITRRIAEPVEAARALLAQAPDELAPFGVPAESARWVAVLYLVEIAARYLHDRQAEAGARLGHVDAWLLPVVEQHLAQLAPAGQPQR